MNDVVMEVIGWMIVVIGAIIYFKLTYNRHNRKDE